MSHFTKRFIDYLKKNLQIQLLLVIMVQDKNYVCIDFQPSRMWLRLEKSLKLQTLCFTVYSTVYMELSVGQKSMYTLCRHVMKPERT